MGKDFQRVAIVNRGDAAMRFLQAVQEYNQEYHISLRTLALFTEPDRHALYVREADEAIALGPATYVDPRDGERRSSYLNHELLQQVLQTAAAEAVWVGWGFVAEQASFVELCDRLGLVFIGPGAAAMRNLGDKITAKKIAEQLEIPVIPWLGEPAHTLPEAREHAERLGYPVIIKSSAGGGGRGIRPAHSPEQLATAFARARSESLKVFGDPTVYVERLLEGVRHVEVQILADQHGTFWPLGVRDCSIQRRHQKILEEAPAPGLKRVQHHALQEAAVRLCQSQGYVNCGSVEFLLDPRSGKFWFMEVNTRLQVEHAVTELTTRLDLVKLQIHVARGGKLEGRPPRPAGHAVEVRLNAEDPANLFAPAPGTVDVFRLPSGPGMRVDTGLSDGGVVPAEFDSMIARINAHGRDREEALSRLRRALLHTSVVITGGMSNKGFLTELLSRPEVQHASAEVAWLDRLVQENAHLSGRHAEVALVLAALKAHQAGLEEEKSEFFASAHRGRPLVRPRSGATVKLVHQGRTCSFEVHQLQPQRFRVLVEDHRLDIQAEQLDRFEWRLLAGGRTYRVFSLAEQPPFVMEVDGVPHRIGRDDEGVVKAPAPAVVVTVLVKEGDPVKEGERVAVLEAMKMEMAILAPAAGTIKQIFVRQNQQVNAGAALLSLELGDSQPKPERRAGRVPLNFAMLVAPPVPPEGVAARCSANASALQAMVLGYDVDAAEVQQVMAERKALAREAPAGDPAWFQQEVATLAICTDQLALFRRKPEEDQSGEAAEAARLSAEEYFYAYLRNTKAGAEGLPDHFVEKLRRALAHYGVHSLEDSPALDFSLFRLSRARQRMEQHLGILLSILERHLEQMPALAPHAGAAYRALLDRLIAETQGVFTDVNDLAREVRYRYFEQPLLDESRRQIYAAAEAQLDYLQRHPQAPDRSARLQALVLCPQPLNQLLSQRFQTADFEMRRTILEVMTLRFYRIRELQHFRREVIEGRNVLRADYDFEGKCIELIACHADDERLPRFLAALGPALREIPPAHDVVMDFYVWQPHAFTHQDEAAERWRSLLDQAQLPHGIRRVVFVVSGAERRPDKSAVAIYTFRQTESGFQEEKVYRGLHPMMGKRLEIWRLSNFAIERLPSVEDVYLFKGVAHDNPSDQRLFAFVEVRNMTLIEREEDNSVHLPQIEWMLHETLAAMRRYQAALPAHQRPQWNRVLLYVWPALELGPEKLQRVINRLAPLTEGQGIEKVVASVHMIDPASGELRDVVLDVSNPAGGGVVIRFRTPADRPIRTLSAYDKKVVQLRRRGMAYPYDLIRMLTPYREGTQTDYPAGEFQEYDLTETQELLPVSRPPGENQANIVVGVLRSFTAKHPEGMARVALLGDPSKAMGALAEPECRRIIAGLDLAQSLQVPLEWYALSAGALISMGSGTENMDWIARVLRRIIEFTQAGGEINVVVTGINVGAQPYWNAEATMLMHTRGILIMIPQSAMVLTGKQALEYSGGVAAEDNEGIGGYERVMGPNGQAQYFARDLGEACRLLLRYYEHAYRAPGERFPRPAVTSDPLDRDVRLHPHGGEFETVGEVFSNEKNPGRKKAFDIRKVMRATIDQDYPPLERWFGMRDAEIAVVWDAHLGGQPVCLLGFESRPLPRLGIAPADGPAVWTGGTLFPLSSKKVARALNSASNNRPLVVLANLSGFDGSPESLRNWQLEYGAEIGRAVVNFRGPIVFCVISRYHGGAFVVFSNALHDNMEVVALEGSYASVIGGAPAAAVVFSREVDKRTREDGRVAALDKQIALAQGVEKVKLRNQWQEVYQIVYSEKLGQVAEEFDAIHSIERAQRVGSVNTIIPAVRLRPYLIEAVARGMQRTLAEFV